MTSDADETRTGPGGTDAPETETHAYRDPRPSPDETRDPPDPRPETPPRRRVPDPPVSPGEGLGSPVPDPGSPVPGLDETPVFIVHGPGSVQGTPPAGSPVSGLGETGDPRPKTPRWVAFVDHASMWPTTLIVGAFAASGQHLFAREINIHDPWAWGATALFELVMIGFLIRGYLRARDNLSPALWWMIAVFIGSVSILTQLLHSTNTRQMVFYGASSAFALLLWFAKLYDSYRKVLRANHKVIAPIGKYGRVWILNPKRAFRAMLVGTNIQSDDVQQTLRLAWVWQATNHTGKIAKVDRMFRIITAWNAVYAQVGLPTVTLPENLKIAGMQLIQEDGPSVVTVKRVQPIDTEELPSYPPPAWAGQQPARRLPRVPQKSIAAQPASPRPVLPEAPISAEPAPMGELERWVVNYADQINQVQEHVDRIDGTPGAWRTRPGRITVTLIRDATGLSGKETLLKIRKAIESLSDRGAIPPKGEMD